MGMPTVKLPQPREYTAAGNPVRVAPPSPKISDHRRNYMRDYMRNRRHNERLQTPVDNNERRVVR